MHIRGDKDVRFEAVGKVIAVCQQVGILKVGFLTQPPPNDGPQRVAPVRFLEKVIFHGNVNLCRLTAKCWWTSTPRR